MNKIYLTFVSIFILSCIFPSKLLADFRFVSWGDAQDGGGNSTKTSVSVNSLNPKFTIFNGDFESSGFQTTQANTQKTAMNGGSANNGIFAKTFLVRGNHDNSQSGSAALWSNYMDISSHAQNVGVTNYTELNSDLTYSFDYENVRFIAVDVAGGVDNITSTQVNWIDERLTDAETKQPQLKHVFLYWHGPLYCVTTNHCNCNTATASCTPSNIVSVINKHPIVSATFHGHEHVLAWTHLNSTRISGLTQQIEQFVTSPTGAGTYNSGIIQPRIDYYNNVNTQGFAAIDIKGNDFTVSFYRVGTTQPVWTKTFTNNYNLPTSTPSSQKTSDVNGDKVVNILDVGILVDNYNRNPVPNPKADINSDSRVDIIDIGLVIDNYGKTY